MGIREACRPQKKEHGGINTIRYISNRVIDSLKLAFEHSSPIPKIMCWLAYRKQE